MAEGKKPKTVDEIVSDYQKYHHATGRDFKERVKKFEEFNDPESIHATQFAHHAHYVVFGHPTDTKNFPGAYNTAHKVLDQHLDDDNAKLDDEAKLTEILEAYTNSFLEKAIGKRFKDTVDHAKSEGLDDKAIRELKGQLLSTYLADDEGRTVNILSDQYIKELKGNKKVRLIEHLRSLGERSVSGYSRHLVQKALDGIIVEEDRVDMVKYISPIFKEKGWKHKYSHITRTVEQQAQHYGALLQGAGDILKKSGYKVMKKEEKEK